MRYRLLLTLLVTACSRGSTGAHAPLQGGTNGPDAVLIRLTGNGGTARAYRWGSDSVLWTSPQRVPIFDGHNDVLLRLHRRAGSDPVAAFFEGGEKGQLDFPKAREGGFAGGLFAIFVPSTEKKNGKPAETPSSDVALTPSPPAG